MTDKQIQTKSMNALESLASKLQVSTQSLQSTLKATAFKECKSNEDFISAVIVANKYGLNPLLKEIYAFPAKGGGITPIVSIDGWVSLVNRQESHDGMELIENFGDVVNQSGTKLDSVTAKFYQKGKNHPIVVTEYMEECYKGDKETWKKWPRRMLRHKAYIQGARVAYGFSGIYDPDEAERIDEAQIITGKPMVKEPKEFEDVTFEPIDSESQVITDENGEEEIIQPPKKNGRPITEKQMQAISKILVNIKDDGTKLQQVLKRCGAKELDDLSLTQASNVIKELTQNV